MDGLAANPASNVPTDLVAVRFHLRKILTISSFPNSLYDTPQAIDTGSTLIYVPNDVAKQFYALVPMHFSMSTKQSR